MVLVGIIAGATIHERNTYEAAYAENNTGIDVYTIEPMAMASSEPIVSPEPIVTPSPVKEMEDVIKVKNGEELIIYGSEHYNYIILEEGAILHFRGECLEGYTNTYIECESEDVWAVTYDSDFNKEYINFIGSTIPAAYHFSEEVLEKGVIVSVEPKYIDSEGKVVDNDPYIYPAPEFYGDKEVWDHYHPKEPEVTPDPGDTPESPDPGVIVPGEEEKDPGKETEDPKKEEEQDPGTGGGAGIDVPIITPIPDPPVVEDEPKDNTNYNALIGNDFTTKRTKKGVYVTWTPINGADGYDVYFNYCGKNKVEKVARTHGNKLLINKFHGKKIQNRTYKVQVKAYRITENGTKEYFAHTVIAHVAKNGKLNAKKVNATMPAVIKVGESTPINVKAAKQLGEKHTRSYRYATTDPTIAKVKNGQVIGMKAGTCEIYVYAVNGVYKKFTVTVIE